MCANMQEYVVMLLLLSQAPAGALMQQYHYTILLYMITYCFTVMSFK